MAENTQFHPLHRVIKPLKGPPPADASLLVRIDHALHSHWFHIVVLSLLAADMIIVVACGVMESSYLTSRSDDCEQFVNCAFGPPPDAGQSGGHHRLLMWDRGLASTTDPGTSHSLEECEERWPRDAHGFGNHSLHDTEKILAAVSSAILIFFLIEQVFLMICGGFEFFSHPLHMLDFAVVFISLVFEFTMEDISSFVGLLICARVWRYARIGHGIYEAQEVRAVDLAHQTIDMAQAEVSKPESSAADRAEKAHCEKVPVGKFKTLNEAWARLPRERWNEFSARDGGPMVLTEAERAIAEELTKSPELVLRALALSRGELTIII